ncbi:MAG: HAD-IA family hydrolase [Luteitalea sp.]|nr:HAD-IA family hydrolase [Luteitalea sp.]
MPLSEGHYPHIVFDLDGTLVDSQRDLADAANALVSRCGGRPLTLDAVISMVGEGARKLVERVVDAAAISVSTDQALEMFLELYEERLAIHTRPYDGMVPTLERLGANRCISVLTNKPHRATERLLEMLALAPYVRFVVAADHRFPRKPAPDGLRHLLECAGVTAAETLLVGDSWVDLHTARAAGTAVCLARYGFGFANIPADERIGVPTIDRPGDLLRVVTGSGGGG